MLFNNLYFIFYIIYVIMLLTHFYLVIWERRKGMFYLMMHTTHFYIWLYGNLLPPLHGPILSVSSKGSFICTIPE